MREFVSNENGVTGLSKEDSESFVDSMMKGWRERKEKNESVAIVFKTWPEQWAECAKEAGDEDFRIWLSPDEYVILVPKKAGIYKPFLHIRGVDDVMARAPASIEVIAAGIESMGQGFKRQKEN
jgi:hypothetical protein